MQVYFRPILWGLLLVLGSVAVISCAKKYVEPPNSIPKLTDVAASQKDKLAAAKQNLDAARPVANPPARPFIEAATTQVSGAIEDNKTIAGLTEQLTKERATFKGQVAELVVKVAKLNSQFFSPCQIRWAWRIAAIWAMLGAVGTALSIFLPGSLWGRLGGGLLKALPFANVFGWGASLLGLNKTTAAPANVNVNVNLPTTAAQGA